MIEKKDRLGLRVWIEINKKALLHNVSVLKKIIGKNTNFCAVVKSNAYGHGLSTISQILENEKDVNMLAVDSITEATRLRDAGIKKPILVLGYTLKENISIAIERDITITVSHFDSLSDVVSVTNEIKKQIKINLKIDTGMHRQGFSLEDISLVISKLKENKNNIILSGVYTHFASAKNPQNTSLTETQLKNFSVARNIFMKEGIETFYHTSASAGSIIHKDSHFDMVRIGAGLYGMYPSEEIEKTFSDEIVLEPVLSLRSIISEIKTIKTGEGVGYDHSFVAKRDTRIAIVPVGYWHGVSRSLSNIGNVIVCGKKAPIVGRISMDMMTIDITDIEANLLDVVTIIGEEKDSTIDLKYCAKKAGTSEYEFVTRLNPLIKKIVV